MKPQAGWSGHRGRGTTGGGHGRSGPGHCEGLGGPTPPSHPTGVPLFLERAAGARPGINHSQQLVLLWQGPSQAAHHPSGPPTPEAGTRTGTRLVQGPGQARAFFLSKLPRVLLTPTQPLATPTALPRLWAAALQAQETAEGSQRDGRGAMGLGRGLSRELRGLQCPQAHPPHGRVGATASTTRGQQGKGASSSSWGQGSGRRSRRGREQARAWGCDRGCQTRTEGEARSGGQDGAGVGGAGSAAGERRGLTGQMERQEGDAGSEAVPRPTLRQEGQRKQTGAVPRLIRQRQQHGGRGGSMTPACHRPLRPQPRRRRAEAASGRAEEESASIHSTC